MSQNIFSNIVPSTTSGNQLATLLNDFKDAVATGFKGPARPANLQAGGYWVDDVQEASPNFLWKYKMWTGTVDILVFSLNISTNTVIISGTTGTYTISQTSADALGPILNLLKKRIAAGGQSLIGDDLGSVQFQSTDTTGAAITSVRIRAVSLNNTTSGTAGAYLVFEEVDFNSGTLLEKMRLTNGNLAIGTVTPLAKVHVLSTTGIYNEIAEDSTTGSTITRKKRRVSGSGQVLSGDFLGKEKFNSTDNVGADIDSAFSIEVSATETHTAAAQGTKAVFKVKKIGTATAVEKMSIGDQVQFLEGHKSTSEIIGSHATESNNVKIKRSGTAIIQAVPGNDAVAEGTMSTTVSQFGHRVENFTFATLPAAGNAGRIAWTTDQKQLYVDDGTIWKLSGGAGGGSSLLWQDGVNPPVVSQDAALNQLRLFMAAQTQTIVCSIKVPSAYGGGSQLKAVVDIYSPDSSGTVLIQTVATLIRKNTDAITSVANQRTSTNTALTQSAPLVNVPQPVVLDLTDSSGAINGVAVAANDIILVSLKRGTDTATSDVSVLDKTSELVIG